MIVFRRPLCVTGQALSPNFSGVVLGDRFLDPVAWRPGPTRIGVPPCGETPAASDRPPPQPHPQVDRDFHSELQDLDFDKVATGTKRKREREADKQKALQSVRFRMYKWLRRGKPGGMQGSRSWRPKTPIAWQLLDGCSTWTTRCPGGLDALSGRLWGGPVAGRLRGERGHIGLERCLSWHW